MANQTARIKVLVFFQNDNLLYYLLWYFDKYWQGDGKPQILILDNNHVSMPICIIFPVFCSFRWQSMLA